MPIRCSCPNGHRLKVQEALAGSEAACPQCGAKFVIPDGGPAAPPPAPTAEQAVEWRLANPQGEQFGPTVAAVFAQWIDEGRVQPDWLVWRTGWPEWKTARDAEPDLPAKLATAAPAEAPPPPPAPNQSKPKPSQPSTAQPEEGADALYLARRKRGARRRRMIAVLLGLAVIGMLGVLVWLLVKPPA